MTTPAMVVDPRINFALSIFVTVTATVVDVNDSPIARNTFLFNNHSLASCIARGTSDATTGVVTFQVYGVPNSTRFSILVDADSPSVNHVVHSQVTGT